MLWEEGIFDMKAQLINKDKMTGYFHCQQCERVA